MPAAPLTVDALSGFLDSIVDVLENPRADEALRKWTEEATGEIGRSMTQGRSPDGTPFAPIKEATRKRRKNPAGQPLTDEGDLLLSVIGDGQGHFEEITDTSATLGTEHQKKGVNVAAVHQFGSKKANIPKREFMGVNDDIADAGERLVAEHIDNLLAAL